MQKSGSFRNVDQMLASVLSVISQLYMIAAQHVFSFIYCRSIWIDGAGEQDLKWATDAFSCCANQSEFYNVLWRLIYISVSFTFSYMLVLNILETRLHNDWLYFFYSLLY